MERLEYRPWEIFNYTDIDWDDGNLITEKS